MSVRKETSLVLCCTAGGPIGDGVCPLEYDARVDDEIGCLVDLICFVVI